MGVRASSMQPRPAQQLSVQLLWLQHPGQDQLLSALKPEAAQHQP